MSDKDLRLQVILSAVDKLTRPFKAMQASNRALASAVKSAKDQLKQLERQSGQLQGFAKTKQQAAQAADALHAARDQASRLALAMKSTDAPAARQVRQFQQARAAVTQLQAKYSTLQTALQTQRAALQQSGIATRQLADAQRVLKSRTAEANTHLAAQQQRLEQQAAQQKRLTDARSRYHQAVGVRNQLAGTGAAMAVTGGATLMGMKPALSEAAAYSQHVQRFRAQGVSEQQVRNAKDFVASHPVLGNSQTELMKLYTESWAITRDQHHTQDATVQLARAETAIKMLGNQGLLTPEQTESFNQLSYAMLKNAELRNEIQDPKRLASFINESVKAFAVTQTMVTPKDTNDFMKRGGSAAKDIDRSEYFYAFGHLIKEMGGESTGNALNSARRNWIGKSITERSKDEMDRIGLIKNTTYSKTGHVKDFTLINQEKFIKTPFKYLMEEVVPRIKKAFPNLSDEGVQLKIGGLFSNRTASDLFATLYNQRENIQKQLLAGTQAQDIDTLLRQGQHTSGGQELILEAKKHDLYKNIGEKVLPLYVKGLEKVSAMLDRVNAFFARHQQAAKVLTVTAASFGLLLSVGGALTLALASLLGPVALLRYGFSLLGIKGGGALSLLGKAIRATATAGRVLLVGALRHIGTAIVWLGRLMFANPILAIIGVIAGAAVLIWQNWDTLGPKFNALWESVSQTVREKWQAIQDYLQALPGRFKDFGTRIIDSLMDGINEKWQALKNKLTSLTDYLPDWMKGNTTVQATRALHPLANYAGEHDRSGRIPAGRFGLVGELGPEIISGPVNVTSRRA
ncbi:phage tail tape measure protein, partial [Sodalis sp.]|uniref:phage tail tape measure protein n=1 Tax=Sodalis sp. (in: enterobacteria) TaxID=1898979 RepID=UPI0038731BC1